MESLEMTRVAERVRMAREAVRGTRGRKGLTQAGLAYEVGVSAVTIFRLEREKSKTKTKIKTPIPSLATVVALAHALDVSLDWLVLGRGPKRPVRRSSGAKKD